ncbi:hypothetical protein [Nakamurella deserti]|uniref:hypothetical protein n=1 Tax=Nakamurella deserti TaxID=2164074 RepID=UPI000DBE5028|nr:hypothetical protein [Nakamurella deserti]
MSDPTAAVTSADGRSTWVVLCPGDDGRPRSEYIRGTDCVADRTAGVLRVVDGHQVVREYAAGAWSNFCEWVTASTDYFASSAVRLATSPEQPGASDTERLLAGAMRMDTDAALSMLRGARRDTQERRSRTA